MGGHLNPADRMRAASISGLLDAHTGSRMLPGIQDPNSKATFIAQLIESERRARFYQYMRDNRTIDKRRADPRSDLFEPILGAVIHADAGAIEEACWLVFCAVHFGRNRRSGWLLARDVYGGLGTQAWNWPRIKRGANAFRGWLAQNQAALRSQIPKRGFGNHRKYQSLSASSHAGTGAAVATYVDWISTHGSHAELFARALAERKGDPRDAFDDIYRSMSAVSSSTAATTTAIGSEDFDAVGVSIAATASSVASGDEVFIGTVAETATVGTSAGSGAQSDVDAGSGASIAVPAYSSSTGVVTYTGVASTIATVATSSGSGVWFYDVIVARLPLQLLSNPHILLSACLDDPPHVPLYLFEPPHVPLQLLSNPHILLSACLDDPPHIPLYLFEPPHVSLVLAESPRVALKLLEQPHVLVTFP